jgi:hypothetical protein
VKIHMAHSDFPFTFTYIQVIRLLFIGDKSMHRVSKNYCLIERSQTTDVSPILTRLLLTSNICFHFEPQKIYNFMHTTQFYQQNSKGINVLIRTKTPLTWISLKMFNILTVMLPQILLIKLVNNSLVRIGETSVVWLLSIKQ